MGTVSLAAVKFGEIILGWKGWQTLLVACSITLTYSTLGGLKAVIVTDFVQFILAMIGSILAMFYIINLPQIGGIKNLTQHENVIDNLSLLPNLSDPSVWVPVMLVPLLCSGGQAIIQVPSLEVEDILLNECSLQKMKKMQLEQALLFNIAHYALRPWPWIIIALSSLIVFPELADIQRAFPDLPSNKLGHDVAYPAMLSLLPSGLLGLVAASLIAAFMSTMSTQLNLGASYLVNDFYKRFINQQASENQMVKMGRLFTIISIIFGAGLGLILTSASQAFELLLMIGAGTGLIYLLRWFWWRINAYTEIVAMISSLIIAYYFNLSHTLASWQK